MDPDIIGIHNALFESAEKIVFPILRQVMDRQGDMEITQEMYSDLVEATKLLKRVVYMNPINVPAMWLAAKAHQLAGENESAYQILKDAYAVAKELYRTGVLAKAAEAVGNKPAEYVEAKTMDMVLRELSAQCVITERFADAVYYGKLIIELDPDDLSHKVNCTVALLLANKVQEAVAMIDTVPYLDEFNDTRERVSRLAHAVLEGKVPVPASMADVSAFGDRVENEHNSD